MSVFFDFILRLIRGEIAKSKFFEAIKTGNEKAVRAFLDKKRPNIKDKNEQTPLHYAIEYGRTNMVQILLENGADIGIKNKYGWLPLHYAIKKGHVEIAKLLTQYGADVRAKKDMHGRQFMKPLKMIILKLQRI